MAKRKAKARKPRTVKEPSVSVLRRQRAALDRQLKQLNKKIAAAEKTQRKQHRRRKSKAAKEYSKRQKRLKRNLGAVRKLITRFTAKRKRQREGTPKQRAAQKTQRNLKAQRTKQVYGQQQVYNYTPFNYATNNAGISTYLGGLWKRRNLQDSRIKINVTAVFRKPPEGMTFLTRSKSNKTFSFSLFGKRGLVAPSIEDIKAEYGGLDFAKMLESYLNDIVHWKESGNPKVLKVIVTVSFTGD